MAARRVLLYFQTQSKCPFPKGIPAPERTLEEYRAIDEKYVAGDSSPCAEWLQIRAGTVTPLANCLIAGAEATAGRQRGSQDAMDFDAQAGL